MLKKCLSVAVILFAASISAHAQEIPQMEFAATYSLFVADMDALDNEALHGYGLSAQYNFNRWLAGVGEWTSNHGASGPVTFVEPGRLNLIPEVDTRVYALLFGPRVTFRMSRFNLFGHYLLGIANTKVEDENSGFRTGNGEFAMGLGGGLDFYLGKQFAIRAAQFDYLPIHTDINTRLTRPNDQGVSTIASGSSSWTQNARFQAGIVYRWGAK